MSLEKPPAAASSSALGKALAAGGALSALLVMASRVVVPYFLSARSSTAGLAAIGGGTVGLYLWIGVGSALGGMARFWCANMAVRLLGPAFPWGTLFINVLGSFVIGFFAVLTGPEGRVPAGATVRQFVMAGLCGGYTTFSAFSLETLTLMKEGAWLRSGANIGLSVLLCLMAVWIGYVFAAAVDGSKWL
jgi:fluoride exporter